MGKTVVPVTQADALLARPSPGNDALDLTGTLGTYVVARTVPAGERWTWTHVWREASTGSSRIRVQVGGVAVRISVIGTAEETPSLGGGIVLDGGDSLGMEATGNGADTAISIHSVVSVEDSF